MTTKGKEVYRSIKRTLSATHSSGFGGTGNARYSGYNGGKQWIHPPDVLSHGRVEYSVKLLGQTEVESAKGTEVIRDAIRKIRFKLQVDRGVTGTSGSKLRRVELQINVDGLTIVDGKNRMALYKYPLHRISFCADDKTDKRIFSFIAKAEQEQKHDCFVFLSDKLAEEITVTIGEAFDLAYQKFLSNNGRDLENKKQLILLRKRIAELEEENCKLKEHLAAGERIKSQLEPKSPSWEKFQADRGEPPELPTSPIPAAPPVNIKPPPSSKRSTGEMPSSSGPEVGRKLENLSLDQMEDLFDDSFDPRAGERSKDGPKDPFGLDPFDVSFAQNLMAGIESGGQTSQTEPTAAHLEHLINIVDERLAEMKEGFSEGLGVGDTGGGSEDLLGDFDLNTAQDAINDKLSHNGH